VPGRSQVNPATSRRSISRGPSFAKHGGVASYSASVRRAASIRAWGKRPRFIGIHVDEHGNAISSLPGSDTVERVEELRQRNLTRRRARHGPNKIQHQDDKKFWLVEIGVFPIVARKGERSVERLVSHSH
jgi:hypothetical protein